jgi:ADP-ribose pyrophosphatase
VSRKNKSLDFVQWHLVTNTCETYVFFQRVIAKWRAQKMRKNKYPDTPQVAVGAVVVRDSKVLLVKRGHPPGEGLWAIPGGSVELGETLQQAAEREIKEETRLTIRAGNPIYTFDVIERDDTGRIQFHYVIVDVIADFISGKLNPDDDARDARWVSLEELEHLPVSPSTRDLVKKLPL